MKKKAVAKGKNALAKAASLQPVEDSFAEVIQLIQSARQRAYQAVNTELVTLYWQVGEYISRKLDSSEWGMALSTSWRVTSRGLSPVFVVLHGRIYFECGSFMRLTGTTQLSRHC